MKLLRLVALLALPLLAACYGAEAEEGDPAPVPVDEVACVAAGGRWSPGGLSPRPVCFLPTPDAGQACSAAGDCSGFCLAESRSCSPEQPRFGCFAILDEHGAEVTLCVD